MSHRRVTTDGSPPIREASREGDAPPQVLVQWRRLPGNVDDVEQAARDVAETVARHIQRRADAPLAFIGAGSYGTVDRGRTAQARFPISYQEAGERIVGVQWQGVDGSLSLLTNSGQNIETKSRMGRVRSAKLDGMDAPERRRKPPKINVRPGRGGLNRRIQGEVDPTAGLDEYGKVNWFGVRGQATVGVMELDPDGNAVLVHRLSSEDSEDRFVLQLAPNLAVAKSNPEVRPRYALFAENMSGRRRVRPEGAGAPPAHVLERDDMQLLFGWVADGWVEHVVWRDGDRIARDVLPGETILDRMKTNGIRLWLSSYGREMDFDRDRLQLRAMMMISAEEREASCGRMQRGMLDKGPLSGNGWPGHTPFGFVWDKRTRITSPDPEQWTFILRAFELADVGEVTE